MKKIAVLIPSYKPGNYIESCLKSLDRQTISKDEFCVYIGLNGPKESYEDYILSTLSKMEMNYKYIYMEQAGVSNARNRLIDMSEEEFIVFVDDDDQVSENYLEELLSVSSTGYIGISNIHNFENSVLEYKENYIGKTFQSLKSCEVSLYKSRKYFSSPWAKMVHRGIIKDIRFDTALSNGEDSLFMATLSKNVRGVKKTAPSASYFVYERVNSASRSKPSFTSELRRVNYLLGCYFSLLTTTGYNKVFVLTRIAATVKQLTRLL